MCLLENQVYNVFDLVQGLKKHQEAIDFENKVKRPEIPKNILGIPAAPPLVIPVEREENNV